MNAAEKTHENAILRSEAILNKLRVLEKHWASWDWNAKDGNIEFRNEPARQDYQQASQELDRLRAEGRELGNSWEQWNKSHIAALLQMQQ